MEESKKYLGDGVYVDFDGYQVILETDEENLIYLEPAVIESLFRYIEDLYIEDCKRNIERKRKNNE